MVDNETTIKRGYFMIKYIVDDKTKTVLMQSSQKECFNNLKYYLNNGHDAYVVESIEGYKLDEFTLLPSAIFNNEKD